MTGTRDEAASYPWGISGCLISGEVLVTSVMASQSWRSGGEGNGLGGVVGGGDDGVWGAGRSRGTGTPGNSGTTTLPTCECNFVLVCTAVTRLTYRLCCFAHRQDSCGSSSAALPIVVKEDSGGSPLAAPPSRYQPTSHIWKLNSARY